MPEEGFDLEREVQKRMAQKRGLLKLRRKGHPEEDQVTSRHRVDKLAALSRKATETRSPALVDQVSLERENWERDAGWVPDIGYISPERRRGLEQDIIFDVARKPVPPPTVKGMTEEEKLIARLNMLVEQLQRENRELKKRIDQLERR